VPAQQFVTSFPSKSELALNLSTNGQSVTFMGYASTPDQLDVSNSNTPGALDPTNPVPGTDYRLVAQLNRGGHFGFTPTNAYSGNNGRAAILNSDAGVFYTAGNAGERRQPAAGRDRRGRGRSADPGLARRGCAECADAGRQLQHHRDPLQHEGRQDRQG